MVEEGRVLGRRAGKCFQLAGAFCKVRDGLRNHAKQRSYSHCERKITQKMYDLAASEQKETDDCWTMVWIMRV